LYIPEVETPIKLEPLRASVTASRSRGGEKKGKMKMQNINKVPAKNTPKSFTSAFSVILTNSWRCFGF
jgi:hypothetical protein